MKKRKGVYLMDLSKIVIQAGVIAFPILAVSALLNGAFLHAILCVIAFFPCLDFATDPSNR